MVSRDAVLAEAESWTGTPWKHQGRVKGLACDCIGLIGCTALALGIEGAQTWRDTPAYHNYSPQPDPDILLAGCDLLMDPIPIADALPADVYVMRFKYEPQHFAFLSHGGYVIHALASAGKVAEARLDGTWRKRAVAAYRFRGVV